MSAFGEVDFISQYILYSSDTEVPVFFNRWSAICGLGAYLGREMYFNHGHFRVNPNLYCMLIGSAGTKKSSAIKLIKKLLQHAGYEKFAAERISKEKFLMELSGVEGSEVKDVLSTNLFGDVDSAAEMFIAADEFNTFIGSGNIDFISTLGGLWDFDGLYPVKFKNAKSFDIHNPVISILGGNTPTGFAQAFPPEIIGQGFFSRLLLIYGEPNGIKITFPRAPDSTATTELVRVLQEIKGVCRGQLLLNRSSEVLLDKIYRNWKGVNDVRFDSYSNRRFTHLLKLCLIFTASRGSMEMRERDIIAANTILTHTEHLMPKALGEFGKAKHSDVSHKILQVLDNTYKPISLKEIFTHVHQDLSSMAECADLVRNLVAVGKIQSTQVGFLVVRKVYEEISDGTVDYSILSNEERKYVL